MQGFIAGASSLGSTEIRFQQPGLQQPPSTQQGQTCIIPLKSPLHWINSKFATTFADREQGSERKFAHDRIRFVFVS